MGFSRGPLIPGITSGLTLYLDPAKYESFPSDSSSILYNMSTSGINGTLTNSPTYTGRSRSAAIDCDGTDDYILLSSTITLGNGNWTVGIWANADSASNHNLMSNNSGGPVTNAMGFESSRIFYRNYDGSWLDHSGNTTLSTSSWYYLTWVNYEGASASQGTMKMFVNGVADSSTFNSYTVNGGPCNSIGRNWFSTFNGKIATVQVYEKSLTDSEVLQNYNATKSRFGL